MNKEINQKINRLLISQGISHPEIHWFVKCQFVTLFIGICAVSGFGNGYQVASFVTGGLLASFNLSVLARLVPQLIWVQKGAVFALLISFYFRLIFTALILVVALVALKLPAVILLAGLSTLVGTLILGIGKYIVTLKHEKEA
jgi:hypothetical protein